MTGKSDDWDDHDDDDDDNDHENNNKCCHPCLLLGERIVTFPSTPAPVPLSLLSSTVFDFAQHAVHLQFIFSEYLPKLMTLWLIGC